MSVCGRKCDVYSRVTGYHQPVSKWNHGKKEEFKQRKVYKIGEMQNEINRKIA
jgi:ribonucleoside-triphosphate reductase